MVREISFWRVAPIPRLGVPPGWGWSLVAGTLCLAVLAPLAAIVVLARGGAEGVWPHLASTVLPIAVQQTLVLIVGAIFFSLVIAAPLAFIVSNYRFPGRGLLQWMLVLPLAIPTYIMAYAYTEVVDFTGPLQTAFRAMTGYTTRREYWFPEMRTLGGAIFIMTAALYPYVYVTARAAFETQARGVAEVARTLGRPGWPIFWTISLPLARPALAAGSAFVAMECLNDIGAVEFLGVRTITVSIYTTWLQRSSIAGAAQLALLLLGVVLLLLALERAARHSKRYHVASRSSVRAEPGHLTGWRAIAATVACSLPVFVGFAVPAYVLIEASLRYAAQSVTPDYWQALGNSLLLATFASVLTVGAALLAAAGLRLAPGRIMSALVRWATAGYAIPGAVIALGIIIPLANLDNTVDAFMRAHFGVSTGLILSGSIFALLFAYLVRFLAVAFGAIEAGYAKMSPNLDAVARTLGHGTFGVFRDIHFPLLRTALGAAAILVFVDSLKELPATLLLRPFNFDTLATMTYGLASLEQFNQSAPYALTIVLAGVIPVILLTRSLSGGGLLHHVPPTADDEQAKDV